MKLAVHADPHHVEAIQELLSVWEVSWVSPEDADVVIVYAKKPPEIAKKTILIPSGSDESTRWNGNSNLIEVIKPGKEVVVAATPAIGLSITPEVLYDANSSPRNAYDDLIVPQFDIIKEYERILRQTLTAKSSAMYRLATSFPLPYGIVPKRLRDYFMKEDKKYENLNVCDVLPIDALRFALVNAIEQASKAKLCRKTWDHKMCACVLTHDVDTEKGEKNSRKVKKLEDTYDAPSAWFIPSKQYALDHEIIKDLENNGEIGSHDTKHDGRLSKLSNQKLIKRLDAAKKTLESLTSRPVEGFRAPLLQHTHNILHGLEECGFKYDTSIPTWEAKHPRTMRPHGIGTVFPTIIEGMNEIPITIMQDHQFLHVMDYAPKDVIAEWLSAVAVIKELGGCCVFLSHPEYALLNSQDLSLYEELLNVLTSDDDLLVALPNEMVQVWTS